MRHWFVVHPDNPQSRLLRQAVSLIQSGGIVVYPTDSGYALGCGLGHQEACERIRRIRQMRQHHYMSLVCRDLSNIGDYANISKPIYRLLKAFTPGAYTFILNGSSALPKMMYHPKRKTLGLRIPENPVTWALLEMLEGPLMSTTLALPNVNVPLCEPQAIADLLGHQVDLILDIGYCDVSPTTVIDLTEDFPKIIREGKGDITPFREFG
jgi:tRNA threonylcarbamoyl adenosine modification protein (Sua5/YciO/YrdC/YwlC family)